ncbi:Uncharacterized protein BP5553_00485 [Venustampulla echinocandica]|uniref:FAD protein n=1 Tax=Venustampulla echinocandica TaxID=2656787 RepID=A0A370TY94_9HELO|nr:Uncharacterized protein BP5553_00485 [Venustampulla echinocandica]RDL40506.1 Uncharacterized protein BP5553_00485 [Venustampulla echinocandica]
MSPSTSAYAIREEPLGSVRHVRVVTIGAGASGLNMIRTLRNRLTNFEHVVYEKNPKVGGTWYENRYPGCKCDIPSHSYQFSWKPNPSWTSFFSPAEEIQQYLCRLCDEEKLDKSILTSHKVVRAEWDEEQGIWKLQVQNLVTNTIFDDYCHFLLDASGILNNWKWPDIEGLRSFTGELIHSADWPKHFEYAGKRVAVIGNGSSGIQIVPAIQPDVKQLVHFVRSPTWIVPLQLQTLAAGNAAPILSTIDMDGDKFSSSQIEKFKKDFSLYDRFVKTVEKESNTSFPIVIAGSDRASRAFAMITAYMKSELQNDKRLIDALVPKFPVGCRRLTPGVGYMPALKAGNVRVITDSITRVLPQGIQLKSGEVVKVDAIICATGFDVSFCPRFPLIGRNRNLQDIWTQQLPTAYMSCAIPDFPNYFTFLGPNAPIGHGSVLSITEHMAKYIVRIIQKCQSEGIKAVSPTNSAVRDFNTHINAFMPRTSWAGSCRSWFKNGKMDGPVTALHPGSRVHWFHMLERFRGEDFEYVYDSTNRFAYLGNGFSMREMAGANSTWYLDRPNKL